MHEQAPAATDGVEYIALSDVGLRRANNQDSYAVSLAGSSESFQQTGHLFLVADGMGAHAAGELASKLSADIVPLAYRKTTGMEPWEAIRQAILQANERIHGRGEAHAEFHGMGTTTSTLLLLPEGAEATVRLEDVSLADAPALLDDAGLHLDEVFAPKFAGTFACRFEPSTLTPAEFDAALAEFGTRERRYGGR